MADLLPAVGTPTEDKITQRAVLELMRDGAAAAKDGKAPVDCPHDPGSTDQREQLRARYWIRGYTRALLARNRRAAQAAKGPSPRQ